MYALLYCFKRFFEQNVNPLDTGDSRFGNFRATLDAEMKLLHGNGLEKFFDFIPVVIGTSTFILYQMVGQVSLDLERKPLEEIHQPNLFQRCARLLGYRVITQRILGRSLATQHLVITYYTRSSPQRVLGSIPTYTIAGSLSLILECQCQHSRHYVAKYYYDTYYCWPLC